LSPTTMTTASALAAVDVAILMRSPFTHAVDLHPRA
jgi:hypothetical protein